MVKNLPANPGDIRDMGSIPGLGRSPFSPGEGNGNPLQCSFLKTPMDRGVSWTTVHGVAKESDLVTEQQIILFNLEKPL